MPQYKYRCLVCNHEFEMIMGVKDPNPACAALNDTPLDNDARCFGETVRIPSLPGPPLGGSTPRFYR